MCFPELARHDIHAAVAFGNLDEVKRRLAADPSSACAKVDNARAIANLWRAQSSLFA